MKTDNWRLVNFVVKLAEHAILGTWEFNNFFSLLGNLTYMMRWSLVDEMTPVANVIGIRIVARFVDRLVVP